MLVSTCWFYVRNKNFEDENEKCLDWIGLSSWLSMFDVVNDGDEGSRWTFAGPIIDWLDVSPASRTPGPVVSKNKWVGAVWICALLLLSSKCARLLVETRLIIPRSHKHFMCNIIFIIFSHTFAGTSIVALIARALSVHAAPLKRPCIFQRKLCIAIMSSSCCVKKKKRLFLRGRVHSFFLPIKKFPINHSANMTNKHSSTYISRSLLPSWLMSYVFWILFLQNRQEQSIGCWGALPRGVHCGTVD